MKLKLKKSPGGSLSGIDHQQKELVDDNTWLALHDFHHVVWSSHLEPVQRLPPPTEEDQEDAGIRWRLPTGFKQSSKM